MARRWCKVLGGLVVASLAVAAPALGAEPLPAPLGYVCGRATTPVVVDGVIDDSAWAAAPWTADFVDIEGTKKPLPRLRTRAKLLWDADFLYIAAELTEPHVWGTLTEHDSVIFHDNDFEVFLDPDGDNHKYFELEINALNTEWDLYLPKAYRDGGPALNTWEIPGLKKAIKVQGTINSPADTDTGWTVELAIPWKDLVTDGQPTAPPRDGDQWRINFSRVEWDTTIEGGKYVKVPKKPEYNWVWSPQGVIDMHQPERWGYLQFSTEAPGKVAYRVDPEGVLRDELMRIYHAQKAFHKANGRWAESTDALGLKTFEGDHFKALKALSPTIRLTPSGYEATTAFIPRDLNPWQVWKVDQDSRLTMSRQPQTPPQAVPPPR